MKKRTIKYLVGGVAVLLLSVTAINNRRTPVNLSTNQKSGVLSASSEKAGYKISISGVKRGEKNIQSQTERTTISLAVQNLTSRVIQISPGLQMFLRDGTGAAYKVTTEYLSYGVVVGGPLSGGATTKLNIDFKMPVGSTAKQFIFQLDASNSPTVMEL
jgi:hypothetical protein